MSAAPERREPIDIDEFERRLRSPEPARRVEDPLAELARLLGPQQAADPAAALFADNRGAIPPLPTRAAPSVELPAAHGGEESFDRFSDFPDLRPLLRPQSARAIEPPAFAVAPPPVEAPPEPLAPSAQYEDWAEAPELAPDTVALEPSARRSRKPLYVAAAVIAAGFAAIGSTLAWRGGAHQASGVATIAASTSPTKIQPKDEGGDKAPRESTMLDRTPAPPVKKVVTRDEQPMDVATAAKTPRIIPLGDDSGGAASVPAVAPPTPPVREPVQARSAFPEPKRVKTVSVRADGSIIGADNAPAAAAPKAPERTTPAPARNATPKSAARADATTSASQAAKPAAPKPKIEAKPRVAAVQPQAEPEAVDEEAVAKPAASGAYAVQVASTGSEAEARQTAARLGEKLSGALGGRRPSVVKASDSLYRIRVTGLSKESANAMCGKVKAAGGACFVAR